MEKTLYVFATFGIGMVLGSASIGQIQDRYGHYASISTLLFTAIIFQALVIF